MANKHQPMESYRRPLGDQTWITQFERKRSTFITYARRVTNEEEARDFIAWVKKEKPDARHHCSAFIYHVDGAQPVERSNDDGEPSGTAGRPMLDVLRGSGIEDIAVVVVRYFGGIKLGTGGLVRAYGDATTAGLEIIQTQERSYLDTYQFSCAHSEAGRLDAEIRQRGFRLVDAHYGDRVTFTVAVAPADGEHLIAVLAELTMGAAQPRNTGFTWVEK